MGELRIFHTADWHLGKTIDGSGRTPDHERFFEDFFALAQSRRPDVLLMAGDIFHRPEPDAAAEALWRAFLERLAPSSIRHTVIAPGNHDSYEALARPADLLAAARATVSDITPESEAVVLREADGSPLLGVGRRQQVGQREAAAPPRFRFGGKRAAPAPQKGPGPRAVQILDHANKTQGSRGAPRPVPLARATLP